MTIWCVIVERWHGARAKKPEANSYSCEAERICHGLVDALKLWAGDGLRFNSLS
jgi:hypothetical protein